MISTSISGICAGKKLSSEKSNPAARRTAAEIDHQPSGSDFAAHEVSINEAPRKTKRSRPLRIREEHESGSEVVSLISGTRAGTEQPNHAEPRTAAEIDHQPSGSDYAAHEVSVNEAPRKTKRLRIREERESGSDVVDEVGFEFPDVPVKKGDWPYASNGLQKKSTF
jgi:hypothetical protein